MLDIVRSEPDIQSEQAVVEPVENLPPNENTLMKTGVGPVDKGPLNKINCDWSSHGVLLGNKFRVEINDKGP